MNLSDAHPNLTALAVVSIALSPLIFQPARFAPHEPYRAGLLVVLVIAAFGCLNSFRLHSSSSARPLLITVLVWCFVLLLSTVFSLSPSRALFGDFVRHMGLLTHLALVAFTLLLVQLVDGFSLWRWFWLVGVVVSIYVILQYLGLIASGLNPARPDGPLGLSVFTAGWLALAWLWSAVGVINGSFSWQRRLIWYAGLSLMILAIILTGSRGAFLSWLGGVWVMVLVWAARKANRRLALGLLISTLVLGAGLFALTRSDISANLPLLSRFSFTRDEVTSNFRAIVWSESLRLAHHPPLYMTIGGQPDPFHGWRPLIGYGPESFETFFRPAVGVSITSIIDRPIDRAHNDWFDTFVVAGWLGLLSRLALWTSIWWVALRRLGLYRHAALILPGIGIVMGGLLAGESWVVAPAVTAGALGGCWLWLLWAAFHHSAFKNWPAIDLPALVALTLTTAHIIELQFSFTTVATGLPFWMAIGLLLTPAQESVQNKSQPQSNALVWAWATFASAFLIRSLMGQGVLPVMILLLTIGLIACLFVRPRCQDLIFYGAAIVWGIAGGHIATWPELAAFWDVVTVIMALILLGFRWPLAWYRLRSLVAIAFLLLALLWWGRQTAAFIYADAPQSSDYVRDLQTAVQYVPWDDYLRSLAGSAAIFESLRIDADRSYWRSKAWNELQIAALLNPYDALLAWRLALFAAQSGDINTADNYYAAAVGLWPVNADLWRDWANFSLYQLDDVQAAYIQAQRAVYLSGGNPNALDLLNRISLRLRFSP